MKTKMWPGVAVAALATGLLSAAAADRVVFLIAASGLLSFGAIVTVGGVVGLGGLRGPGGLSMSVARSRLWYRAVRRPGNHRPGRAAGRGGSGRPGREPASAWPVVLD